MDTITPIINTGIAGMLFYLVLRLLEDNKNLNRQLGELVTKNIENVIKNTEATNRLVKAVDGNSRALNKIQNFIRDGDRN